MDKIDILIIGAGVVGLGVASELCDGKKSIFVVEQHDSFGQETSSRNSEVIHAGIYYPAKTLKASLCVEGNRILREICPKYNIPHKILGKLIVATTKDEEEQVEELYNKGNDNGVPDLRIITEREIRELEPNIRAVKALLSPTTGILDSHKLMEYYIQRIKDNGGDIAYKSFVQNIEKLQDGYEVTIRDSSGDVFSFIASVVINSAGLNSDTISSLVGIDVDKENYRLKYCKGSYFSISNHRKCSLVKRLIYPVPGQKFAGLGVHSVVDLGGGVRLGPDMKYIPRDNLDYSVDKEESYKFFGSAVKFLPFLEEADIVPDMSGIRPKLQGEGEDFRDFVIKEESDLGFPGFINLIGIESPGLTAAPAIGKYVKKII